jgi:hypothetical protein
VNLRSRIVKSNNLQRQEGLINLTQKVEDPQLWQEMKEFQHFSRRVHKNLDSIRNYLNHLHENFRLKEVQFIIYFLAETSTKITGFKTFLQYGNWPKKGRMWKSI